MDVLAKNKFEDQPVIKIGLIFLTGVHFLGHYITKISSEEILAKLASYSHLASYRPIAYIINIYARFSINLSYKILGKKLINHRKMYENLLGSSTSGSCFNYH